MNVTLILDFEALVFVSVMSILVFLKFLTGSIRLDGLLRCKDGTLKVSGARVQLLIATIFYSVAMAERMTTSNTLSGPSPSWNVLLGASSATYAASKLNSFLSRRKKT